MWFRASSSVPTAIHVLLLTTSLGVTAAPALSLTSSPLLDPEASKVHWRQIGWIPHPGIPCPAPSAGWASPMQIDAGDERFCIYEFSGVVTPADVIALQAATGLPELAPDRMAVRPSGVIDNALRAEQSDRFLEQVGDVWLPAPLSAGQVHLGLLDTQPTSDPGVILGASDTSPHGRTLRRFAQFLLCKTQPCPVQSHARLSLPHTGFHPTDPELSPRDELQGGLFGTISELGEQLVAEVEKWTTAAPPGDRLVLNLSVAWDGSLFGGLETDPSSAPDPLAMPVDVRLVYRALEDAADAGILVIAAAGNRVDHRQAPGALLPAAWEQAASPSGFATYRPLVYAVGGVDSLGQTLSLSQPLSRPPRLAYADHAVLQNDGAGPTALLTGSSVAALVVSVSAAAAWSYDPSLGPHQLMDLLYLSGDSLPEPVELCLPDADTEPCASERSEVRRLSICRAVEAVCSAAGDCPSPFDIGSPSPCTPWAPSPPDLSALEEAAFVPDGSATYGSFLVSDPGDPCTAPSLAAAAAPANPDPCPSRQYNGLGATPWVRPQPGSNPCPNCPILDNKLHIEVSDDFEGTLSSPSLEACGTSITLPVPPLEAAGTFRVDDLPPLGDCAEGLLTFVATDGDGEEPTSTISSVRISP